MTEEIYVDQMQKWENVWSTIKQLSKEEIAKIPKEFLRTSKIPEHKVRIKKWEKSDEVITDFNEDLSNIMLYDVDIVIENTEDSTLNSSNNDIAPIDQEKAAELMATPAGETSIDSSDNTSQANELTISNTVNNSMTNLSTTTTTTTSSNSTSIDLSSEKPEASSLGITTNGSSNLTNGSNLRYEIIPDYELSSSSEKLPLKKTSNNNEQGADHVDKRMKLDDGNAKEISISNSTDNQSKVKEDEKSNENNTSTVVDATDNTNTTTTDNQKINNNNNTDNIVNSLKRKADEIEDNNNKNTENNNDSTVKVTEVGSKNPTDIVSPSPNDTGKSKDNITPTQNNTVVETIKKETEQVSHPTEKETKPEKTSQKPEQDIRIRAIPVILDKPRHPQRSSSLFDDQGCIILKPIASVPTEPLEVTTTVPEDKMDIDSVEKSDKLDGEQSTADSTFGLKSYNSVELSGEGSYKRIVESIEDSNISSISEVSSFNNEDSLDQSSSVASSNVKRIIERLENNTINTNETLPESHTTTTTVSSTEIPKKEKVEGEVEDHQVFKQPAKLEDSKKPSFVIIEKKPLEKSEESKKVSFDVKEKASPDTIQSKDTLSEKVELPQDSSRPDSSNHDHEISKDLVKEDSQKEEESTENIPQSMEVDEPSKPEIETSEVEKVIITTTTTTTTVTSNENSTNPAQPTIEKKTEVVVTKTNEQGETVQEKRETTTVVVQTVPTPNETKDAMDVDDQAPSPPKEEIVVGGSVGDKIKLFEEKSASSNENSAIDRQQGETKLQEIKMTILENQSEGVKEPTPTSLTPTHHDNNTNTNVNHGTVPSTIDQENSNISLPPPTEGQTTTTTTTTTIITTTTTIPEKEAPVSSSGEAKAPEPAAPAPQN